MKLTLFEYLYRDAGNFKAFGCLALEGALNLADQHTLRSRLSGDGLFIAEQLNVPPLYKELYQWSDGPTSSDHCWHEFAGVEVVDRFDVPADAYRWGSAREFLERLSAVSAWNQELSPHFRLEAWA
jgi:hypothetical protein